MKKFLAMLLAVMLVIGLLPMSVLADFAFDFEAETVETPQLDHQDTEGTQPVSEGSSVSGAGLPQKNAGLSAVQTQNEGVLPASDGETRWI